MLTKIIIFLLLFFAVLGSSILVESIDGILYEKLPNQLLEITINDNCCIQPEKFSNFTFIENKNHRNIYFVHSLCINENEALRHWKFFCILNLTDVPSGRYTIYSVYYEDMFFYKGNFSIDIREKDINIDRKDSIIESLELHSKIYEKLDFQNFTLSLYGKEIDSSYIEKLVLKSGQNYFIIPVRCMQGHFIDAYCVGNFDGIKSGINFVYGLQYDGLFYNLSVHHIYFNIYEKEDLVNKISLLDIQGIGYYNERSSFTLYFNGRVDIKHFERFGLRNVNGLQDYNVNCMDNETFGEVTNSIHCSFILEGIPIGKYILNYIYQNEYYESIAVLEIKQRKSENEKENENENEKENEKVLNENKLLNFYGNLKSNKNIEYAFFSFSGKRNINLAYIVLTDENKRKNVLQIFDCKIVDYSDDEFDLKCVIDLSYVSEGKYTLTEYYINNQHYIASIGVHVN